MVFRTSAATNLSSLESCLLLARADGKWKESSCERSKYAPAALCELIEIPEGKFWADLTLKWVLKLAGGWIGHSTEWKQDVRAVSLF